MSNTINPYRASRADLQQRALHPTDHEDESLHIDQQKADGSQKSQGNAEGIKTTASDDPKGISPESLQQLQENDEAQGARFEHALEGAIEEDASKSASQARPATPLKGLSQAEQQMIYRYFPEAPGMELRLYKPDLSTNKVDPGSVGSRVDLRG